MMRKHFRFKRLVLGLAFGLAIAAFSAPAVQATTGPTYSPIHRSSQSNVGSAGKYGPLDPWAYAVIHGSSQPNVVPAGKYGPLDPWAYAVIHRSSPAGTAIVISKSGFNWGDAGIGASVSFGAALVLLAAVGLGRRYRSRIDRSGLATS